MLPPDKNILLFNYRRMKQYGKKCISSVNTCKNKMCFLPFCLFQFLDAVNRLFWNCRFTRFKFNRVFHKTFNLQVLRASKKLLHMLKRVDYNFELLSEVPFYWDVTRWFWISRIVFVGLVLREVNLRSRSRKLDDMKLKQSFESRACQRHLVNQHWNL